MRSLSYPRNTTGWKIGLTDTFRNASGQLFNLFGSNLQNPTNEECKLYRPEPGKILIQADQAGAEALIVANITRSGNFRKLFCCGIKSHVYVALHVFKDTWQAKVPQARLDDLCASDLSSLKSASYYKEVESLIKESDGWPARERYYFIAKMICHASNYGMAAPTFCINVLQKSEGKIVLTRKQAEYYLDTYHNLFPEIREWHKEVDEAGPVLYNLFGHPREFYGPLTEKSKKERYAYVPQSTVGTITNIAFANLQEYIEDKQLAEWDLLNNKHDSILLQCSVDEALDAAKVLRDSLCQSMAGRDGTRFKMKAEVASGYNWGKYHATKNPEGMKEIKDL